MNYFVNGEKFVFITIQEDINNATLFRHFKDKFYKVFTIAKDSETQEDIVVYQQQYGNYEFFVRPAKMFFSDVDHLKYPNVTQKKRFEIIK